MNLTDFWTKDRYNEFLKYLKSLQDKKYQEFQLKIIGSSNNEIIGIRSDILKRIAKEISKGDFNSFILVNKENNYETVMIEGLMYGYLKISFHELVGYLNNYLERINNWAQCDMVVSNLKILEKNQELGFKYAKKLTHNKNNWIKRVGIVILLNYYLHDIYIDKTLELVTKIKTKDYYVRMAIAWLVSIAYIKYKEKTLIYLVNIEDDFIYNKTISKIIDSRRVVKEEKDFLKGLKRKKIKVSN